MAARDQFCRCDEAKIELASSSTDSGRRLVVRQGFPGNNTEMAVGRLVARSSFQHPLGDEASHLVVATMGQPSARLFQYLLHAHLDAVRGHGHTNVSLDQIGCMLGRSLLIFCQRCEGARGDQLTSSV